MESPVDPGNSPPHATPPDQPAVDAPALSTWPPRARRLLLGSTIAGALIVCIGLWLTLAPSRFRTEIDLLRPIFGVTLVVVGGLIGLKSYRLLSKSTPDASIAPGDPYVTRRVFLMLWVAGSAISVGIISSGVLDDVRLILALASISGLAVAGVGTLWVFRWLAGKFEDRWSRGDRTLYQRLVEWSIFFAFVWGLFSTLPAAAVELVADAALTGSMDLASLEGLSSGTNSLDLLRSSGLILAIIVLYVVIAPPVEEIFKALGLRLFRGRLRTHSDGLLLGMAIGLGFGFLESAQYILYGAVSYGFVLMSWMRVVTLIVHGAATGLSGMGYAHARLTGDRRALRSGLNRAILVHAAWNLGAVGLLPLIGVFGSEPALFCCLALMVLATMVVFGRRILPRLVTASIDRSIQDDHRLAGVALPASWSPMEDGVWWNLAGGRPERPPRAPGLDDPLNAIVSTWRK